MTRKNPETVVVSGFSEPISFSVRIVGWVGKSRIGLCDGHVQSLVLRISLVGVPGALLAEWFFRIVSAARFAVPDKIFGLTLSLDFIDRCTALRSLHLPPAALPSLTQRATLVGRTIWVVVPRLALQAEKRKKPSRLG